MRPLSRPLTVVIILSLSLAFGFWLTRQISYWSSGFFNLKYFILVLVLGAAIAFTALWYRGVFGTVQGLFGNPVAATLAKVFAITAGLTFFSLIFYMLATTDVDKYKDFILNRNFVLWVIILPMIATALLAIYAPVGIPEDYRSAIPAGLKKLTWVALLLVLAFMYFFPNHAFTEAVLASADKAKQKFATNILLPIQEKHDEAKNARPKNKIGQSAKSAEREKPSEPKVVYKVYVQSPKMHWEPHPGYYDDKQWYAWAASSSETREECRVSSGCQRAMRRLKEFGCLAPDNNLLSYCRGR